MITSAQIRAGRGLLKWTQGLLAARAAISAVTLNMIESDQVAPRARTLDAIRAALEGEGVRSVGDAATGYCVSCAFSRPGRAACRSPWARA